MLTIFGGSIDDLTPMLTEERFPKDWEPRSLDGYGLTFVKFNFTVLPVEIMAKLKGIGLPVGRGVDGKKLQ
jgi:hypothetical protein